MKNQSEFSNIVNFQTVLVGIMTSFCSMFLSMSLIASLGRDHKIIPLWDHKIHMLNQASILFWILASLAWMFSLYLGGVVTSLCSSREQGNLEGGLNGLATCCGSCITMLVGLFIFSKSSIMALLNFADPYFFRYLFWGNIVAFATGIYGGVVGVHLKHYSFSMFKFNKKAKLVHN